MSLLSCVEVEPTRPANASVIWLHGLGADGHDFEPVVPHLGLASELAVRFVFPNAPRMPVTLNNGFVMPAWYDILSLDLDRRVDQSQLRASAAAVGKLIERENARGVPSARIVIAGFSQGGAVGFELALTWPERLAGLVALSTYFATQASIEPHAANAGLPILVGHGTQDPMVDERFGRASAARLRDLGYAVDYRDYPIEHSVSLEEIKDIGQFINRCLA
ncbi:MAG: dienelactone hydrolase family protein [Gammaproteobacteria bacterium]|nr:dienelactone hydrolase family protein [Gammaproteobacteria bacterium]